MVYSNLLRFNGDKDYQMRVIDFFKLKWRQVLALREQKEAFFRGCKTLAEDKSYDYLYRSFRGKGEIVYISSEMNSLYLRTTDGITVKTDGYYLIFIEIFCNRIYTIPPYIEGMDFVVFDIGMNRAYSSLFFANMAHCQHVYGFELLGSTYRLALENIMLNPHLSHKITAYNYGLWNADTEVDVVDDGIDAHASVTISTKSATSKVRVKRASTAIHGLLDSRSDDFVRILKIDVEGGEYTILEELYQAGLLYMFDIIIGEYHRGLDGLLSYLSNFYLSYHQKLGGLAGMMVFINKRHHW